METLKESLEREKEFEKNFLISMIEKDKKKIARGSSIADSIKARIENRERALIELPNINNTSSLCDWKTKYALYS